LFADDRSGPLFPIPQGTLPWQPILGKIDKMSFIWQAGVRNGKEYGGFNSKIINGNIVCRYGTSCANMIKIGPVTPEMARVTTAPFWTTGDGLCGNVF